MIIRQRFIEDNPVTAEHVDLAERIFGPDVAALKGKRTRRQPGALIDDQIQIPKEIYELHPKLKLEIDLMFMNELPMLTGIDTTVQHRSFEPLTCQTVPELYRALDNILRFYNKAGFEIDRIDANN